MPLYTFVNSDSGEKRDVFFKMNDTKVYNGMDGTEIDKWKRVYSCPQMSIDTRVNPFSAKDFVKKTQTVKTVGELWDRSSEMSHERSEKLGAPDPQKQKAEKAFYKPKKQ